MVQGLTLAVHLSEPAGAQSRSALGARRSRHKRICLTLLGVLIEDEESGYLGDRDANSDDARTPRPLGIGHLNALFLPKALSKAFEHPLFEHPPTGRQDPRPKETRP